MKREFPDPQPFHDRPLSRVPGGRSSRVFPWQGTRRAWLASAGALALATAVRPVAAQQWARKMFKITEHDFGTVARGAKSEFIFEFENLYEETLHVSGVRTSCGCTSASVNKDTLKTWDKGGIVATFNTQSFLGHRSATITVTFDKPFFAEVQLNVQGYIRSDVVFTPGSVDFGAIDQGQAANRKVTVNYAGRSDWQVVDVRSANTNFEVELNETQRGGGRVSYEMVVYLKPEMPEGFFQDQLVLVTNDNRGGGVPLVVEGRVVPGLTVSPASLFLGVLQPGQTVTKQLVVKGREPFRVLDVTSSDERFEFSVGSQEKALHVIPVRFRAGDEAEKVVATIEIATSLTASPKVRCSATATVNAPAGSAVRKPAGEVPAASTEVRSADRKASRAD